MENYLQHHGRIGQHKGVQNGPPYPLDPELPYPNYPGTSSNFIGDDMSIAERYDANEAIKEYVKEPTSVTGGIQPSVVEKVSEFSKDYEKKKSIFTLIKEKNERDNTKVEEKYEDIKKSRLEEKKKEILKEVYNKGNIKELLKNADLFSSDELREISNKIQSIDDVKSASRKSKINSANGFGNSIFAEVSSVVDAASSLTDSANKAIRTWNSIVDISSSLGTGIKMKKIDAAPSKSERALKLALDTGDIGFIQRNASAFGSSSDIKEAIKCVELSKMSTNSDEYKSFVKHLL